MTKKNLPLGFLAGLLVGVVAAVVLSGRYATPRAMAQARQPLSAPQRYQLAAWAYPAGSIGTAGNGSQAMHGAYILDTQTGRVWHVLDRGKPESLGGVESP